MADNPAEPTTDELIALAAKLLGSDSRIADPEALRETVTEERELWVRLYRAHHADPPTA